MFSWLTVGMTGAGGGSGRVDQPRRTFRKSCRTRSTLISGNIMLQYTRTCRPFDVNSISRTKGFEV